MKIKPVSALIPLFLSLSAVTLISKPSTATYNCRPVTRYRVETYWTGSRWNSRWVPHFEQECSYDFTGGQSAPSSSNKVLRSDKYYRAIYDRAEKLSKQELKAHAQTILTAIADSCLRAGNSTQGCQSFIQKLRNQYSDFRLVYISIYHEYYVGLGRDAHPYLLQAARSSGVTITDTFSKDIRGIKIDSQFTQ